MKQYKILASERFQKPDTLDENVVIDVIEDLWENQADLVNKAKNYDALIVRNMTKVDACLLRQLTSIKVIGRLGAGTENIETDCANQCGITVVYAPIQNTNAVAEFCVAQVLNVFRHLPEAINEAKQGVWNRGKYLSSGKEIKNCHVGVIGFGHIGQSFSQKMRALGANVSVYNRNAAKVTAPFQSVSLVSLLQNSDIISIHLPGGDATKGFINQENIGLIKKGAYILNSSRGSIIDENALLQALESEILSGAMLDVRTVEPGKADVIAQHPNVYPTPHIAAFTQESQTEISISVVSDILKVLQGEAPSHPVTISQ